MGAKPRRTSAEPRALALALGWLGGSTVGQSPVFRLRKNRPHPAAYDPAPSSKGFALASDNRDWYRDWWRKRTGYVERAGFRMSEGDRRRAKHAAAWRAIFVRVAVLSAVVVALIVVKRMI